jgi:hypothetical protein
MNEMERNLRSKQPTIYFISPKSLIYSGEWKEDKKMFVDSLNRRRRIVRHSFIVSRNLRKENLHPETSRRKKDGLKGAAFERH